MLRQRFFQMVFFMYHQTFIEFLETFINFHFIIDNIVHSRLKLYMTPTNNRFLSDAVKT